MSMSRRDVIKALLAVPAIALALPKVLARDVDAPLPNVEGNRYLAAFAVQATQDCTFRLLDAEGRTVFTGYAMQTIGTNFNGLDFMLPRFTGPLRLVATAPMMAIASVYEDTGGKGVRSFDELFRCEAQSICLVSEVQP